MQKVFHFDASRERYHAGAAVVWCFDDRFTTGFMKCLKRLGIANADSIRIAGGAKALAAPEKDPGREFLLEQIRASIRLHQTTLVILMVHSDCGGYGGLEAFNNDAAAEARHHQEQLRSAAECVLKAISGIEVRAYFVDFEGVWQVELARSVSS